METMRMAKRKASEITADNVDDLNDDELDAVMAEMAGDDTPEEQQNEPAKTEEQPAEPAAAGEQAETQKAEEQQNGEGADEGDKSETVPYKTFDYERNRRKKLEEERAEERARWEKRFDELMQSVKGDDKQKTEEQQPEYPDVSADALGSLEWLINRERARDQQTATQTREQQEADERNRQFRETASRVISEYETAAQSDPSVIEAYNALRESQGREMLAMGFTQAQAKQQLDQLENEHIAYVADRGLNIVDYIKGLATARGWSAQKAEAPAQQQVDTEAAKAKAKTLSNGGGSPGVSDSISPDQLLNMSDQEFDEVLKKYGSINNLLAS